MLEETEGVVVLFDEFDELVRERGSAEAAPFSRLLTTAMLPKLASIHARGTLVYIIATNNIGEFDLAIRRPGRFDRIVQVMPPTFDAKMGKIDWGPAKLDFQKKLTDLGFEVNEDFKRMLGDLTYGECEEFAARLTNVTDRQHVLSVLNDRWKGCALETKVPEQSETWRDRCSAEEKFNN
jgi:SpoVK/Ycf46/Vps4 family AAA+-type ATPase